MQGHLFDPTLYPKPFKEIVTALWTTFLHSESAKLLCAKGLVSFPDPTNRSADCFQYRNTESDPHWGW